MERSWKSGSNTTVWIMIVSVSLSKQVRVIMLTGGRTTELIHVHKIWITASRVYENVATSQRTVYKQQDAVDVAVCNDSQSLETLTTLDGGRSADTLAALSTSSWPSVKPSFRAHLQKTVVL